MPLLSPLMSVFEPGRDVPCTAYHAATPRGASNPAFAPRTRFSIFDDEPMTSAETVSSTPPEHANGAVSISGFKSNADRDRFAETPTSSPLAKPTVRVFVSARNASANASNNASAAPRASASNDSETAPPNVTLYSPCGAYPPGALCVCVAQTHRLF